jgi:signal transduction histidine kinase
MPLTKFRRHWLLFYPKRNSLFQHQDLDEKQATHLQEIQNASQRLSRLNKSLLLLTKIENRQFVELKDLALHDLIQQKAQVFAPLLAENRLTLQLQTGEKILRANPDLVEMLLGHLLSNAIKHNQWEGKINIILDAQKLLVQNTGRPLAIPPALLFERFRKGEGSTASLGLGLAIVKEICEVYQWRIAYHFENELHQLVITF